MIVAMKKVTVFFSETTRAQTLKALRSLSLMHLVPLRQPEGEALQDSRRRLDAAKQAFESLPKPSKKKDSQSPVLLETENLGKDLAERIALLTDMAQKDKERIDFLQTAIALYTPFGTFDPASALALESRGIEVRLLQVAKPDQALFARDSQPNLTAKQNGWVLTEHESTKVTQNFSLIGSNLPTTIAGATVLSLPHSSVAEMQSELESIELHQVACLNTLQSLLPQKYDLAELIFKRQMDVEWEEAQGGLWADDRIGALRGWCPVPRIGDLQLAAAKHGWGVHLEEPEEDEQVPTMLKQAKWVKPINVLMGLIGIQPGYREIDTSAVFLLFFSLFFAMLVGDAGYGFLFLGMTIWARKKMPEAPSQVFSLMGAMSVVTIIWGTLTGTWFGVSANFLPAWLTIPRIDWLTDEKNLQNLCFGIGTVHLTIAHVWNMWLMRRTLQVLAQLGWLATTWTMFFLANQMVLGKEFPPLMTQVFIGGVVLIFLFNVPFHKIKQEWFNLVMLPLNLVSNFVDVVSYIRLFAVGTASFAVANSFNEMLSPMLGSWTTALFGAIFLFFAHSLNITLAVMGVLVHGVRLNTLEFSNHIGLQWTGVPFRPFSDKST